MKKATTKSAGRAASRKLRGLPVRQRAKRLAAPQRRALIKKEAAVFFAENGFAASTRDLADRLGVRQALLYKYFESKEALIRCVFDEAFDEHWTSRWAHSLSDMGKPLAERLASFYAGYAEDADSLRLRLFLRGALDGWPLPARLNPTLTKSLVTPVVAELRRNAGLPDFAMRPLMMGERELVMMMHGAVVFHRIRQHIYNAPSVDGPAAAALFIATFLQGVGASLKSLHDGKMPDSLREPVG